MNINLLGNQQPASNNEVNTVSTKNNSTMTAEEYISKEQANADYVKQNSDRIRQKGYLDAGRSGGDPIALECGLKEVKNDYISWCHQHREIFANSMREAIANLKHLLQQREAELTNKKSERDRISHQLAQSEAELTRLDKRHYRVVEALQLIFSIVGVILGAAWVSYVYANFFFDLSCSPQELKTLGIFSDQGFKSGIKFAAVPIMLALFIGLAPNTTNKYKYMKYLLGIAFILMDVVFSWNVELRITQIQQAMGIDQAFDIAHFLMVIGMAMLPAIALTLTIGWTKENFYLEGLAEAKAEKEKASNIIGQLCKSKSEVDAQIELLQAEIKGKTEILYKDEGDNENLITWYRGSIVEHLSNLYYQGFLKFVNSMNEPDEDKATTQTLKAEYQKIYNTFLKAA